MQPPQKLSIEDVEFGLLTKACPTTGFTCNFNEIDKWFRNHAYKEHERRVVRVTTVHLRNNLRPIGFYALSLKIEKVSRDERRRFQWADAKEEFTSIYINYFAVYYAFQKQGLGRLLMYHAIRRAYDFGKVIGLPGITLIAAGNDAADFYLKIGFERFGGSDEMPRMLLPLRSIADLIEQNA